MTDAEDPDLVIPPDYVANLFDLRGRVAVITGGGSGLGRAIAIGYAQAGVTVVLADVNDCGHGGDRRAHHGAGRHRPCAEHLDVTQRAEVQALADKVVAEHGHVDILVNSAGSAFRSPAEDFPEEKLDFILDLNLKGTYLCCQAFGKKMLAQGKGSIINLASASAPSSRTRGRAPTSRPRAACWASPAAWRSSGGTGACGSTASGPR